MMLLNSDRVLLDRIRHATDTVGGVEVWHKEVVRAEAGRIPLFEEGELVTRAAAKRPGAISLRITEKGRRILVS